MIEELCEYLVRHGWANHIADDAHDVYRDAGNDWELKIAERLKWMDDHVDELIEDIKAWKKEVGE